MPKRSEMPDCKRCNSKMNTLWVRERGKWVCIGYLCKACFNIQLKNNVLGEIHKTALISRSESMKERNYQRKKELVEQAGGCCQKCGYDKNYAALVFHHPNGKEGDPSPRDLNFDITECILLCANCHMEEHYEDLNT